jgi:predicted ArsR family transcriptional regulator
MTEPQIESSDMAILDQLRERETLSVSQLSEMMQVTATAVRQRLSRLMAHGYIERNVHRAGRGRPTHRYWLTDKGRRKTGANYADLATALWQEIRSIDDPDLRQRLLQSLAKRLVEMYADCVQGETAAERMRSLAKLFGEREIPFVVEAKDGLPILRALACPYTGLAEEDRSICVVEKNLFSELMGEDLRLAHCRLDGQSCCTFELN